MIEIRQTQAELRRAHYAAGGKCASLGKSLKAWVSDQHQAKQLLDAGERTAMTASRVATLERIRLFYEGE